MSPPTSTAAWTKRDEQTITELIERRLETDPQGELFDVMGKSWSAAQLITEADRVAGALSAYGVEPGDRVASLCENSSEQLVTIFAALRLGAVSVPVNTAFKGDYLRHQLRDSGTKVLIVDAAFVDRAAYVAPDLPDLAHIVVVDDIVPDIEIGTTRWHDWLDVSTHEPIAEAHVAKPDDLAVFIYTGGTTGPSKGCMINQNYAVTLAIQIATMWGRTPDDVVWTPLPMFHFNAVTVVLIGTLVIGGRASIYRRFSVSNFWPEINRTGATMASTLGSMVSLLADDPDRPEMPRSGAPEANTTLRFISGVPITPALRERCIERF
ncbi:MAG TPA: class I adenylate-forming enzyme family protein, partial [Microthrixaceae bacterium]|nr:class I adenylate-forming enzyme family protein [Microthrixaceae bacterium]